jgi:hypothetical protein
VKSARKAVHHQGAEIVLFHLIESEETYKELQAVKKLEIRAMYYFDSDDSKIYEL